jgi:hypothetical protein
MPVHFVSDWRQMKRRTKVLIGVGTGVGVLAIVGAAVIFALWDRATPATVEEVAATLDSVDSDGTPGSYGLYVYETTGFETTDALTGARHDYPAQTFLTLQPGGCGTLVRWQALGERWTEWDFCEDGTLVGWDAYNEWFNVPNLDEWSCQEPVPTAGEPGDTWSAECAKAEGSDVTTYEVIGFEVLEIGGEEVGTLHVRTTSGSAGTTEGEGVTDIWTLPDTVLMVQRITDKTSVTETRIGPVTYHEEYTLRLESLAPTP